MLDSSLTLAVIGSGTMGEAIVRGLLASGKLTPSRIIATDRRAEVSDAQAGAAIDIFGAVGRCLELEDKLMDAVTSVNGSGPAFAYVFLEAICDGAVRMGLRRDAAMEIAAQMFQGAARMVLKT